MTEKEAIEILKYMNDGYTFQDCRVCVSNNKFNEKQGICESKTCEYLNAINTVIQALEQKDKEIQELKEIWDKDTYTLQNQLDLANADRVEKDKMIDLIIEFIWIHDFCSVFPENRIKCKMKGFEMKLENCKNNCIKQYFQKKASEENV